jgi:hypothetical protein
MSPSPSPTPSDWTPEVIQPFIELGAINGRVTYRYTTVGSPIKVDLGYIGAAFINAPEETETNPKVLKENVGSTCALCNHWAATGLSGQVSKITVFLLWG